MKIALIGGTGFVGSYLVDELVAGDHHPVLLVRPGSEDKVRHVDACTLIRGDVRNPDDVRAVLEGCEGAIYNIGILREFPGRGITFEELQRKGAERTIDIAVELGVARLLLMSANGVKADGTDYQRTKFLAEEYLRATDLAYSIFRPSVIFGDPRGRMEFCSQLRDEMIHLPVPAPLFYEGLSPFSAGMFTLAPVHVKDVARAFVRSLHLTQTYRQTFTLCGSEQLPWKAIIHMIAGACGTKKLAVPVPAFYVKSVAYLLERFEFFPITRDQISMLLEGNTCASSEIFELLGIEPTRFSAESLGYLRE